MNRTLFLFVLCILFTGTLLYSYISRLNDLTILRRMIPALEKEVKEIQEENVRLQYAIQQFRTSSHLLELLAQPEYRHLKFLNSDQIITLEADPYDPS